MRAILRLFVPRPRPRPRVFVFGSDAVSPEDATDTIPGRNGPIRLQRISDADLDADLLAAIESAFAKKD